MTYLLSFPFATSRVLRLPNLSQYFVRAVSAIQIVRKSEQLFFFGGNYKSNHVVGGFIILLFQEFLRLCEGGRVALLKWAIVWYE